jgi:NTE family protein
VITGRFDGLLDMRPLYTLVRQTMSARNIARCPADFHACVLNLATGGVVYAPKTDPNILSYIIASTAIPLMMPITVVGGEPFWDGGVREVAPLNPAIKAGATEIVCIACEPEDVGATALRGRRGPLGGLAGRLMDLVINETLNNDIDTARDLNRYLEENPNPSGLLAGRRSIRLTVIRPERPLEIELASFRQADVCAAVEQGAGAAARRFVSADL